MGTQKKERKIGVVVVDNFCKIFVWRITLVKISYKMFKVLISFVIILQRNFLKSDVIPRSFMTEITARSNKLYGTKGLMSA